MKRFRQKYYDHFSHIYDRFVALHSTDRALRLRFFLADNTGLKKGDKALDICTGTGSALIPLKEKVQAQGLVAGVDFSIGMLKAGRSKISDNDRALQNLTIFVTPMKRVDFSEVTGVRALKRPAREPWPPAHRAYAPEGTEEKPILFKEI